MASTFGSEVGKWFLIHRHSICKPTITLVNLVKLIALTSITQIIDKKSFDINSKVTNILRSSIFKFSRNGFYFLLWESGNATRTLWTHQLY